MLSPKMVTLLSTILAVSSVSTVFASWSFELNHHPLVAQRADLIVFPGSIAGHMHQFAGSAALFPSQDRAKMCTTADIKDDRSLYWAPGLYHFDHPSGVFRSIPLLNTKTIYADGRKDRLEKLIEYPEGLMIIGGNSTRWELWDDVVKDRAKSFTCYDYSSGSPRTTNLLPKGPCRDGLVTRIVFPSCWDGKRLDTPNHHDHMAYPLGGNPSSGVCPKSHPHHLLTITYEQLYDAGSLQGSSDGKTGFILSTADMLGSTMHGDFVNGWKKGVLQEAIDKCPDMTGLPHVLDICPAFKKSIKLEGRFHEIGSTSKSRRSTGRTNGIKLKPNDQAYQEPAVCTTKQSVMEKVLGQMNYLPGCRQVMNGPAKGSGQVCPMDAKYPIVPNGGGPDDVFVLPLERSRESASSLWRRDSEAEQIEKRGLLETSSVYQ